MKDKPFHFKQFSVQHHRSSMKVGTDALLLGAWCEVVGKQYILEVGCGCGVISLMLAQRNADAHILAIDIDAPSIEEAQENFSNSIWSDRLKTQQLNFMEDGFPASFDLIVCNPPFFLHSLASPNESRNKARHLGDFDRLIFFKNCQDLSTTKGTIALIVPFEDTNEWSEAADQNAWYPTKRIEVKDTIDKPSKRMLIEFRKHKMHVKNSTLILKDNKGFSGDYAQLLKEFQIIF